MGSARGIWVLLLLGACASDELVHDPIGWTTLGIIEPYLPMTCARVGGAMDVLKGGAMGEWGVDTEVHGLPERLQCFEGAGEVWVVTVGPWQRVVELGVSGQPHSTTRLCDLLPRRVARACRETVQSKANRSYRWVDGFTVRSSGSDSDFRIAIRGPTFEPGWASFKRFLQRNHHYLDRCFEESPRYVDDAVVLNELGLREATALRVFTCEIEGDITRVLHVDERVVSVEATRQRWSGWRDLHLLLALPKDGEVNLNYLETLSGETFVRDGMTVRFEMRDGRKFAIVRGPRRQ